MGKPRHNTVTQKKTSIEKIFNFMENSIRSHGWIILFYSITIVACFILNNDFTLTNFDGRVISQATSYRYEIGARLNTYILSVILFVVSVFTVSFLGKFLKTRIDEHNFSIINLLAFVGVVVWFLVIFTLHIPFQTIYLVIILHAFVLGSALIQKKLPLSNNIDKAVFYGWSISLATTTLFLGYEISPQLQPFLPGSTYLWFILGSAFIIELIALITLRKKTTATTRFSKILYLTSPLLAIPFLSFVSDELYLILNSHSIFWLQPSAIYLLGLAGVLLVIALLWFRSRTKLAPEPLTLLQYVFFPGLLLGVLTLIYYRPFLADIDTLFEPANPGLMIQQLFDYGKIPFIENFNAHGLSDALWGMLYAAFNGLQHEVWHYYDFFQKVIEVLLAYFVVLFISRNPYVALGTILLFPHLDLLFPPFFTVALAIPFLLWKVKQSQTTIAYTLLFFGLSCLFIWRLDIGFAVIAATAVIFIIWRLLDNSFTFNWRSILKVIPIVFITIGTLSGLLIMRDINPIIWIKDFLAITDSSQTFGIVKLAK